MISLEQIFKIYTTEHSETKALNGLSLHIKKNDAIAILGPSGSGKTTLLDILGTLSLPTKGSYTLFDKSVYSLQEKEIARLRNLHFGFVFQTFNLLPDKSVYHNVELPLTYSAVPKSDYEQKIIEALKETRMEHKRYALAGYLSGGEQQRVAIARALVLNPEVILADEPTGNLDSENGEHVLKLLLGLWNKGKTLIMITHNEVLAESFPRVLRILDGKIIYDGPYAKPQTSRIVP